MKRIIAICLVGAFLSGCVVLTPKAPVEGVKAIPEKALEKD